MILGGVGFERDRGLQVGDVGSSSEIEFDSVSSVSLGDRGGQGGNHLSNRYRPLISLSRYRDTHQSLVRLIPLIQLFWIDVHHLLFLGSEAVGRGGRGGGRGGGGGGSGMDFAGGTADGVDE